MRCFQPSQHCSTCISYTMSLPLGLKCYTTQISVQFYQESSVIHATITNYRQKLPQPNFSDCFKWSLMAVTCKS